MANKRRRDEVDGHDSHRGSSRANSYRNAKRPRLDDTGLSRRRKAAPPLVVPRTGPDLLSPLSDELLIRILSFLPLDHLLNVSPVSHRFHRLASDSHLWKALYYDRFVLPRAMRIPGFRDGGGSNSRLHYSGRRALWVDGRQGGLVRELMQAGIEPHTGEEDMGRGDLNWKRQFKIRHNWSRGKCSVEELRMGGGETTVHDTKRTLVKVVDGIAITADKLSGLRAWDLKSREILAQVALSQGDASVEGTPSCIAVDDEGLDQKTLYISLGFYDGSFGVWSLDIAKRDLSLCYRHEKSSNGKLIALAFSYPYLLTATESVLASLYTFEFPGRTAGLRVNKSESEDRRAPAGAAVRSLQAPLLLTSLTSNNARAPLALSIRKGAKTSIASIAYTFNLRHGWSVGMQDIHVTPGDLGSDSAAEVSSSQVAYTEPLRTGRPSSYFHDHLRYRRGLENALLGDPPSPAREAPTNVGDEPGPTSLCYTHPYLLAALPDNTLVLWLCRSTTSSLTISPSIRLWGHTSGISDAEITSRGKAVSVSRMGEEMRVWELEGRSTNRFGGMSVEVRPEQLLGKEAEWDERRNWVGFDDEMVIVLKEKSGTESLMVYDFT